MYIVDWRKDQFDDSAFLNAISRPSPIHPLIASFSLTSSEIAAAASARGFALVDIVLEAAMTDVASNHRSHHKALNQLLPVMFQKQAKLKSAPAGTRTAVRVSTRMKRDCPILSFVDYWLWLFQTPGQE